MEAFEFYKNAFGGKFPFVGKYMDRHSAEGNPKFTEDEAAKIIHIWLPISKEIVLMRSDTGVERSANYKQRNIFSVSIKNRNKRGSR